MKKTLLRVTFCIAAGMLPSFAFARNYYVDPASGDMSNPGTAGEPWSTLEAVFAAGKTFVAGDTITCRNGFHGSLAISGDPGDGAVTIQAEIGQTPRLKNLIFSNASHWIVSGLDLSPMNAGPRFDKRPIVNIGRDCSFITIDRCYIYHAVDVDGWKAADFNERMGTGIDCKGADCTFTRNHIKNTRYSLAVKPTAVRATARHNLIEYILEDGIRCLADDGLYEYNTLRDWYGVTRRDHDDGFQSWSEGPGKGTVYRNTIRGNLIINLTDPDNPFPGKKSMGSYASDGIGLFDGMYEGWVIENNVIMNDNGHGIALFGGVNCRVSNNTVIKNPYRLNDDFPWITITRHKNGTPGSGNILNNNLSSIAPIEKFAIAPGVLQSGNRFVGADNAAYFVDYAHRDLHLKAGSPAIDAGSTADAPAIDIDRDARSVPYDVGAYEYVGGDR